MTMEIGEQFIIMAEGTGKEELFSVVMVAETPKEHLITALRESDQELYNFCIPKESANDCIH